jgi:murein DD-endopeptidase MepM/ murein hydrolase activator NlpD
LPLSRFRARASRHEARASAACLLVLLAPPFIAGLHAPPRASAQQEDEATTTTGPDRLPLTPTSTSTSTSAPPSTTSAPTEPTPPGDGSVVEDSGPSEVPQDVVVVPPPAEPAAPDPATPILRQIAGLSLAEATKGLREAEASRVASVARVDQLVGEVAVLEERLANLEAEKAQAAARLQQSRTQLKKRAIAGYMDSPASPLNRILESRDFNDLARRFELLEAVAAADAARIDEYGRAREAAGEALTAVVAELDAKRVERDVAIVTASGAESVLLAKQIQVSAVQAGGAVIGGGFVFPVAGPNSFADTFGAPRMFGTAYAHLHQGTDVFAASGTPLVAVERGVLIKVGTDVLGGTKLWLVGASGTRYYYAHLSAFAPGVSEGLVVSAGDVVGYVGNSGNALSTPAHVHFEVHPNGGAAVNPYPLLRIVADAQKRLAGAAPPRLQGATS